MDAASAAADVAAVATAAAGATVAAIAGTTVTAAAAVPPPPHTIAPAAAPPPPADPRRVYFDLFQAYLERKLPAAQEQAEWCAFWLQKVQAVKPATEADVQLIRKMLAEAQREYSAKAGRLEWLNKARRLTAPQPRLPLAVRVRDKSDMARDIERVVSQIAPLCNGAGTKEQRLPVYVYTASPERNSEVLDTLFSRPDAGVCVLTASYSDALCKYDGGDTAHGALRAVLLRLLASLMFGAGAWQEWWEHSPLADPEERPICVFRDMLGLRGCVDSVPARLLLCIDAVSNLLDSDVCAWTRKGTEARNYLRTLNSLTSAAPVWARLVMTGQSDSPLLTLSDAGLPSYVCR